MIEATYSTGQSAKLLETSSHHIRRLCETGFIEADLSQGKRWRIPAAEVERLKREGLPPIPQPAEDAAGGAIAPAIEPAALTRRPRPIENPAPPPAESDSVRDERDDLTIAETQLKRRRVDLEREEVEDQFRDRERKATHSAAAERRKLEEQLAAQRRREWEAAWIQQALGAIPADAPQESRIEVYRQTKAILEGLDWQQPPDITRRVVEAVVYQALQPHFQARSRAQAIAQGISAVPSHRTAHRAKAKRLAEAAVSKLPANAPMDDLTEAVDVAVGPIIAELQHEKAKAEVLDSMRFWGWDATASEQEQAREAVAAALDEVPAGSPSPITLLNAAKAAALAPIEKAIRQRKAEKQRKEAAAQAADSALWRVDSYLRENFQEVPYTERWAEERRLKAELRPVLIAEILDGLATDDLRDFVDEWLDENAAFEDDEEEDDDEDDAEEYDDEEDDEDEDDEGYDE